MIANADCDISSLVYFSAGTAGSGAGLMGAPALLGLLPQGGLLQASKEKLAIWFLFPKKLFPCKEYMYLCLYVYLVYCGLIATLLSDFIISLLL